MGDHLRKVRLDRGLSQPQVAGLLQVTTDSVAGWETNRNHPTPKYAKAIITFLGYFPFTEGLTLGKRLYHARLMAGKTQEEVAKMTGCDESNLRLIELERRKPRGRNTRKIGEFIDGVFGGFRECVYP
ncbi:MAG: helix-turn-helix domain-containing protein [Saprospiraceae bacterium]|nr:helix-turn-helix domain-containing protein [Saprospiraceae bacterium]